MLLGAFYCLDHSALEYLSRGEPSEYPILLSLTYSNCRFAGVEGAAFAQLKRFKFFLGIRRSREPSRIVGSLESLKVQHGWDIRVRENWLDEFWHQEMDGEL